MARFHSLALFGARSGVARARGARSLFAQALDDLDFVTRMLCEMLALPLKGVAAIFAPLQFAAAFAHDREAIASRAVLESLLRCFFAEAVVSARTASRTRNSGAL